MRLYYSNEDIDVKVIKDYNHGIFLAGPTPRSQNVKSWRPEALEILEDLDYGGIVWIPEYSERPKNFNYIRQVEWEKWGLTSCSKVVFWVPRDIVDMPAFTTNIEFGRYVEKSIYGRPNDAVKCEYLDWLYTDVTCQKPHNDLRKLLKDAINE